ncbi:ATP-binding protein [Microtetraspora sp. NBRC 13810]|uniref:ATP-binding protein n=1 Tax=Microtetraspora sp. NBRC 13810 TaxID=3030990 RepID=UPI0024A2DD55|nr:ATP-binding protein [Microtetraspora sp. NBRC 13810]GLW05913.1 ATP-binding protein [Microtetraspora sp. NBRC 13810]
MPYPTATSVIEGVDVPRRTYESILPGEVTSVRAARGMVLRHLAAHGDMADDCALIVSELVTNAVLHGGTAVRVRLILAGRGVYAEIADDGEGLPAETDGDLDATGGRGLLIVGRLAGDWGVVPAPGGGKVVWFVLGEAA